MGRKIEERKEKKTDNFLSAFVIALKILSQRAKPKYAIYI
jgi:hypothetical protein